MLKGFDTPCDYARQDGNSILIITISCGSLCCRDNPITSQETCATMEGGEIMKRIMTGSLIVLSLLIIGLLISLQGTLWANATKTEVTGIVDFSQAILIALGEEWVDEGGNTHIQGRSYECPISLFIGEQTIEGRDRIVFNGVVDEQGNATLQMTEKTYFFGEPGDEPTLDNIFFEGSGQCTIKEDQTVSGHYHFQGHGEFSGTKLVITTFVEIDTTNIHEFEGILIDLGEDE
jgi:hypothetical protein